jgi:hypothetical protein
MLRPRARLLRRPRLLRLGPGTLGVALPSQGLCSRPLHTALKKAQFVDFGCRSNNSRPAKVRARHGESSTGLALDACATAMA